MRKPILPIKFSCAIALITIAKLILPISALAATASTTFAVTATVISFCTVSALPLVFGNYSSTQLDSTTTISTTCSVGTPYTIGLSAGTGSGATVAMRVMTGASSTLNYTMYQDSGHTLVWGSTAGTDTVAATGTGLLQSRTVYGRIPGSQFPNTGAYTDTITVTVTY